MAYLDYTFGIEVEFYLPEAGGHAAAAAAVAARLGSACIAEQYNHHVRPHWKIVTDNSLGDYTRGAELVSPVLRGDEGLEMVRKAMDALADFGCTVSRACGVHVHVGVEDAMGNAVPTGFFKNLLSIYRHFEPVIDGFMPPSRRANANNYCRSVTDIPERSINRAATLGEVLGLLHTRYRKLNFDSFRKYKTVEFRQHSGTLDAAKACNWIAFCLRMVDAVKMGKSIAPATTARVRQPTIGTARPGSKAHMVGQMMLREIGVTNREAMTATGWPSISLPQQARACGLTVTRRRVGGEIRYFATGTMVDTDTATAIAMGTGRPAPATLDGLFDLLECPDAERDYFRNRTANLGGRVQWAA